MRAFMRHIIAMMLKGFHPKREAAAISTLHDTASSFANRVSIPNGRLILASQETLKDRVSREAGRDSPSSTEQESALVTLNSVSASLSGAH